MSWRTRWRLYEYVRNSIWIVPAIFATLALVAGIAGPDIDESVDTTIGIEFGSDAARSVLGAIAGGMITFTGFVFSILLLAVQFGSSQFSPRLLRRFLRDPTTKIALGLFIATFLYSLAVLRVVGTAENQDFVPSNAIALAMVLLLLSMLVFLRLISRTTQGLRVATVLKDIGSDARDVIDVVYPERLDESAHVDSEPPSGEVRAIGYSGPPGILQSIDANGLMELARDGGAVIELVPRVGELIAEDKSLFRVYGDGGAIDDDRLQGSVAVGDERTMRQDVGFAFRLLADISAKALSPGVNDPTTATQALDEIELLLRQLVNRRLTPGVAHDDGGTVRLRYPTPSWEDFLSLALDETRHFSEGSVQVTRRLRALLTDLREIAPESRRPAINVELELVDSSVARTFADHGDRLVAGAYDRQGLGASGTN